MPTTISSREFNQHAGNAKKSADLGPVFITDRGRPAHVLLSMQDYQRMTTAHQKIADLLAMPGTQPFKLATTLPRDLARAADLS